MFVSVDWVSITIMKNAGLYNEGQVGFHFIPDKCEPRIGALMDYIGQFDDLAPGSGRKPFNASLRSIKGGFTIYFSDKLPMLLFEFSGVGCDRLEEEHDMSKFLGTFHDRITRLDIAGDIPSMVDVKEFAAARDNVKFKSEGYQKSETGDTEYIGSRTSDRYCRVYRYHAPHPRAGVLRIEGIYKDDHAKSLAHTIAQRGVLAAGAAALDIFKFTHPVWLENHEKVEALPQVMAVRRQGKTVHWLLTQVLPAIQKLADEGELESLRYFAKQVSVIVSSINAKD